MPCTAGLPVRSLPAGSLLQESGLLIDGELFPTPWCRFDQS